MGYLDRILDDGTDRDRWLAARLPVIGASDAAKLARAESVHLYLASKLESRGFHGNVYTESGNRWEPMMLAWAGIAPNKALIHSPAERGFAATPDGIAPGGVRLAECKAKHGKVVLGPTAGEWRQIAWQFEVVPEADELEFIVAEIMHDELRGAEPKNWTIKRSDPKVQTTLATIRPIATDLLARLTAALEFERQLAS